MGTVLICETEEVVLYFTHYLQYLILSSLIQLNFEKFSAVLSIFCEGLSAPLNTPSVACRR